jgi:hypothetical protein
MEHIVNKTGPWCDGETLCEHNLIDAPHVMRDVCSGLGGICVEGSAYSNPHRMCVQCGKNPAIRRKGKTYKLCSVCGWEAIMEVIDIVNRESAQHGVQPTAYDAEIDAATDEVIRRGEDELQRRGG